LAGTPQPHTLIPNSPPITLEVKKVLSQNERISMPPPKITKEGKYTCTIDKTTFDNMDEYDQHCMEAHTKAGGGKTWQ
jgi:hypothetical protein